ncbi:MAG: tetratricopeptide repeat protein [Candidatus Omnitrophota bacterium]
MIEKKKLIMIWAVAAGIAMVSLCLAFFLQVTVLDKRLKQSQMMVTQMEDETRRLKNEKDKITKENEKLQADAVSYLGINSSLQKERDDLIEKFKVAQKLIDDKEAQLQREQKAIDELGKNKSKAYKEQSDKLNELTAKLNKSQADLKRERGLYHYNLGVACAQAKLFDDAVSDYEKSLVYYPDNAECHYNLGLLYEGYMEQPQKALAEYIKYLELNPDAQDKEDVLAKVKSLKQQLDPGDQSNLKDE